MFHHNCAKAEKSLGPLRRGGSCRTVSDALSGQNRGLILIGRMDLDHFLAL